MNNAPTSASVPQSSALSSQPPPPSLAAIILAAGSSSRLGQPKQLLEYKGRPLLARAAEAALAAGASPVVVVLGAHAEKIRPALATLPVVITENSIWSEGMASSLRTGLTALTPSSPALNSQLLTPNSSAPPPPDAVLIALCDQPRFSAASIAQLFTAFRSTPGTTIAATRHADGAGVPAIFARTHFPALLALRGAEGARRIILANAATTAAVDLPELAFDIDTPADWQRLNSP
jgi:molybdenum cofactor cytidylyltransferase